MPVKSTTGFKGISKHKSSGNLQAVYYRAGVTYLVGYYKDMQEAVDAREDFIKILEENWVRYLSTVSKFCVQSYVRFLAESQVLLADMVGDELHEFKLRVIKEYDTPEDVKRTEQEFQLRKRQIIQEQASAKEAN